MLYPIPAAPTVPARKQAPRYPITTVNPFGFDMDVAYDYDAGELPILFGDNAHPGSAPMAEVMEVWVGGVDISDMLTEGQRARIEEEIIRQEESQ